MRAEIAGGFLTWLGASVIAMAAAWLVVGALNLSGWGRQVIIGFAAMAAWTLARYVERKRTTL